MCLFSNAVLQHLFLREVKVYLFILFLIFTATCFGQVITDSAGRRKDSLAVTNSLVKDSVKALPVVKDTLRPVLKFAFTSDSFLYHRRLFFSFTNPVRYTISEKKWEGKEAVFYSIIGLLIGFALIKNNFWRYLTDLYSSYFRTTVRQRQIKEQLLQNPLPSLLFNLFFILSMGLFLSLVLQHFKVAAQFPFWLVASYLAVAIGTVYGVKFLVLKLFGWVFQMTDVTNTYIFIVFATNKILGITLLPFTVLLAFTYGGINEASLTLSLLLITLILVYRYFLSYISLSRNVRLNFFHFVIYLLAFEIVPLLLINKLLVAILREIS